MFSMQPLFDTIYHHLRGHSGDDQSGESDQRADEMEFLKDPVYSGGKEHDGKIDEYSQKERNTHRQRAVLGGSADTGGDDTGAGDERSCQRDQGKIGKTDPFLMFIPVYKPSFADSDHTDHKQNDTAGDLE